MKKQSMTSISISKFPAKTETKASKLGSSVVETSCVQGNSLDELAKVAGFSFKVFPYGMGH